MEITYASIKSLIKSEVWEGNQVKLKFQSNDQAQAIETMGVAMPDQEEMMKKMMAEMAKSSASNMAINAGANALGGMMGEIGSSVAGLASSGAQAAGLGYQMDPMKMMQVDLTEEVKQKTILAAFMNLQMFYEFKENTWHYKQPA